MSPSKVSDPSAAISFVEAVRLPRAPAGLERTRDGELPSPPVYDTGIDQAVTVGSQIAEFAADVPAELRPAISNSFLLAQLAANRKIQDIDGGTKDWYDKYVDVLSNIGWIVESNQESIREISGRTVKVHKEIIGVITLALGPAVAATSVVISVLNGLQNMNKDQPWITLFDRESQRASANQFQISYAALDEHKNPRISLFCFEFDASRSVTQVLFVKSSTTEAHLSHFEADLGMNETVFGGAKGVVENRIALFVDHYIADIEI